MRRSPLLLLALAGALGAGILTQSGQSSSAVSSAVDRIHVWPFGLMDEIRDPSRTVPMQVQVYNEGTEPISLLGLTVQTAAGEPISELKLHGERLEGDGGELANAHLLIETIDPEISHRHHRLFIPEEERRELSAAEEAALIDVVIQKVAMLKEHGITQARNLDFEVELSRLFPEGSLPGDAAEIDVILSFRDAQGGIGQQVISHSIGLLAPYLPPPPGWQPAWDSGGRGGGAWYAGDMHVHNCRDQALLGCPNCAAESFNLTGAFTNADLKPQFQSLGIDFFSTTTHSYCINSSNEFDRVVDEATNLDDPGFQVIMGTEMTNLETGAQQGTDLFDAVCTLGGYWGRGISHMGGHFLASRKVGGNDGFLNDCDDPLYGFGRNADDVEAEGGFVSVNHPSGSTLGFNSVNQFAGREANQALGIEIWNGGGGQASGDHRAWWLARLKEGKLTYPFSGSDTHDAAIDFGAMHTWISGSFDDASLQDALENGRTYISDGAFIDATLYDNNGRSMGMGGIAFVGGASIPPNYPVNIDVAYNVGTDTATVKIFRGEVGTGETLLQETSGITGAGTLTAATTVPTGNVSWYRAELFIDSGPGAAYTTPQFIVP